MGGRVANDGVGRKGSGTPPGGCLRPACPGVVNSRGLCKRDYEVACALVRRERTTWAALEAAGKARPATKIAGHGSRQVWFLENGATPVRRDD